MVWLIVILVDRRAARHRADHALQPVRPAAEPRRQRLGADRGAAQAALGSDPEPRRDGEGLRRRTSAARSRRSPGARSGAERTRAGRGGRRRRASSARRSDACSPSPRRTRSCRPTRTSASSRTSWPGRRTGSRCRARSTTTRCSRSTTRSRRSRASCSPGRSGSRSASSSRPTRRRREVPQVDFGAGRRPPPHRRTGRAPRPARRAGHGRRTRWHERRSIALAAAVAAALVLAGVAQAQTYELVSSDVQVERAAGRLGRGRRGDHRRVLRLVHVRVPRDPASLGRADRRDRRRRRTARRSSPGRRPSSSRAARRARSASTTSAAGRAIVWRFQTDGFEQRTFVVHYRMTGLAVGYDDVVDVNLKVWGDEWEQRLGRLTATMRGPGDVVRAWGHPVWVRGDVTIDGQVGDAARARRRCRPVRRAARALPARGVHVDRRR